MYIQICNFFESASIGGRGKKASKKRGQPSDPDQANILLSIQEVQPPSLPPHYSGVRSSLKCCVCMEVLDRSILLPCNELVCGPCCSQWVAVSGRASCPCCYSSCIGTKKVRPPPTVVVELLGGLTLSCEKCQQQVKAAEYLPHLMSKCKMHTVNQSPLKLTVGEILATPTVTPPTPIEKKAASRILKRLMADNPTDVIKVPTSGQVRSHTFTCTCSDTCRYNY